VRRISLILLFCLLGLQLVWAQRRRESVTYEELYDAPYDINKLFVSFQPLYGEMFVTNVNVGFGVDAHYYWDNKFDFKAHMRKAYAQQTDFTRNIAMQNNNRDEVVYIEDQPNVFNLFEIGATYHIKDEEKDTETKFILYSKTYKGRKWEAKVPEHIMIPTKVRKVIGARLGGLTYQSSVDLNRTMEAQGVELMTGDSAAIDPDLFVFGNLKGVGGYIGASISMIKNVGIKFDKTFGVAVNDLIFNAYFDILVMPMLELNQVHVMDKSAGSNNIIQYPTDVIDTNMLGFRVGMEGKFNREWGWGYGAEMGLRPSVKSRSFYAMMKVSFPVYSTTLNNRVEAFGK